MAEAQAVTISPAPGVSGGPTAWRTDQLGILRVEWIRIEPKPLHPSTDHVREPSSPWPAREGSSTNSTLNAKSHEIAMVERAPSRSRKNASKMRSRRVGRRGCVVALDAGAEAGFRAEEVAYI